MGENPAGQDYRKNGLHGSHVNGIDIIRLTTAQHLDDIRALFVEYAESLDFDLDFQNFKDELVRLPGEYAPPEGCLIIAFYQSKPAGCVGLRKLEKDICEMKRLYVRPEYRALGIGKALADSIIRQAAATGYKCMRLDTVPAMQAARHLYLSLGFKKIAPYCYNPVQGATFWEKKLN